MNNIKDKNNFTIGVIDGDKIKDQEGQTVAWINANRIKNQDGQIIGWIKQEEDTIGGSALLNLLRKK
jgi:hypothetical protein